MPKIETYSDNEGNSITITTDTDGVYVSANIRTKSKYTGGANANAARQYAKTNHLNKE